MKTAVLPVVLLLSSTLALSGCCTSLMCNARQAAAAELSCDGDLQVTNVSQQVDPGLKGETRTLEVAGCGQKVRVRCEPTNLKKPVKRYREDVVRPQSRLDLKWRCEPGADVASK